MVPPIFTGGTIIRLFDKYVSIPDRGDKNYKPGYNHSLEAYWPATARPGRQPHSPSRRESVHIS